MFLYYIAASLLLDSFTQTAVQACVYVVKAVVMTVAGESVNREPQWTNYPEPRVTATKP